jgi:guanylate kinase
MNKSALPPITRRGLMLVLSSPSGAGKTTLSRRLLEDDNGITISTSATTRPPRLGEVDGKDYKFVDQDTYDSMVSDNAFLEYAHVFDNCYGTPAAPVFVALDDGKDVLFDIDWQGTQQLAQRARSDLVSIFILPPSTDELERRLHSRAQDADDVVAGRMAQASDEMSHWSEYDYVIVNEDVEASLLQIATILNAERMRRIRQDGLDDFVNRLREGE